MSRTSTTQLASEELVFAITSVSAAAAAGAAHGDLATASALSDYYGLVADAVRGSEGRVVKVIGDGVLIVFPLHRAKEAVENLRDLQSTGTEWWSAFDPRCRLQVKVGSGSLATGLMGPPRAERFDVYGSALNELFKMPPGDFVVAPELSRLLE